MPLPRPFESMKLLSRFTVRQGILCASDTTIEWGLPNLDQHGKQHGPFVVSGEGSVHQCRDWNSVKGFLEAHRGLDNKHDILPA